MSNHPYPEHVVMAVADKLAPWLNPHLPPRVAADNVLQALWDASRINTLDELDSLNRKTVVISRGGHVADDYFSRDDIDHADLPVHVIYWGNND